MPWQIAATLFVEGFRVCGKYDAMSLWMIGESMACRTPFSWPPGNNRRLKGSRENDDDVQERGVLMAGSSFMVW